MRKALVCPYGFLGDILFASGVAKKLKEEHQFDVVDYVVGLHQIEGVLKLNPWIDNVWVTIAPTICPAQVVQGVGYNAIFRLGEVTKLVPPPMQFQQECGVRNPDTQFQVWSAPTIDEQVLEMYQEPYIAVMEPSTWTEKAYGFTREEYDNAIDVPYKGYGGRLRNISWILGELRKDFHLVFVGMPKEIKSYNATDGMKLLWDVSLLKHAQFFIGTEGGMCNFASGVGTKTVLTSDFVWQLYGPKGVIKRLPEPKLGPRYYFPEAGHVDLNPYLTDQEVLNEYQSVLSGEKTAADYTYDWITHVTV